MGLTAMTRYPVVVALGLVGCGTSSEHQARPAETNSRADVVAPVVATPVESSSPVLALLAHQPMFGPLTVVEVRAAETGYVLNSRRSFCRKGRNTPIQTTGERAELERILPVLDSTRMSDGDPCKTSGRDATFWVVARASADSEKRARMFRRVEVEGECGEFQVAARKLMELAGLECNGTACAREAERDGGKLSCP